jgi:cupin 2 domain-containing protein
MTGGNLFADIPAHLPQEQIVELLTAPDIVIKRIVSTGQKSPPGFWYDQEWAEWVIVLAGSARLLFASEETPREMKAGDYIHIPAHVRHRVEWTDDTQPTTWLAVHYHSDQNT